MTKRAIFILEASSISGGVRNIYEYANGLVSRGWQVDIYSLGKPPTWFALSPEVSWRWFPDYTVLGRVLSGDECPAIATWWKTAYVVAQHARDGYYLVQDIESSYYFRPDIIRQVLDTYTLDLRLLTSDPWPAEQLRDNDKLNRPDTTYIGLGIDPETFHVMDDLRRAEDGVGAICRIQAIKGYSEMGEYARRLAALDLKFFTFGAHEPHFGGAFVKHYGKLPDKGVARFYNSMSVFASTSNHEGFGMPLLEAMACGCPVVTTNADGNMVFCQHEENCLVVPRGDMIAMTDATERMVKDSKLRARCVDGGLETSKSWRWEPCIDRLEAALTNR